MNESSLADEFEDPLSDYEPAEYASETERLLAEDSVLELQLHPYAEVSPEATIREAVHALHGLKASSLLVVDSGTLVGIFTERDVLEKIAERYSRVAEHPVSEVMVADPIVVYESDPIGAALAAIAVGGYRHVPVLSMSGKILGVVSPRRVNAFLNERILSVTL